MAPANQWTAWSRATSSARSLLAGASSLLVAALLPPLVLQGGAARAVASNPPGQSRPDPVAQARESVAGLKAATPSLLNKLDTAETRVVAFRRQYETASQEARNSALEAARAAEVAAAAERDAQRAKQAAAGAEQEVEAARARLEKAEKDGLGQQAVKAYRQQLANALSRADAAGQRASAAFNEASQAQREADRLEGVSHAGNQQAQRAAEALEAAILARNAAGQALTSNQNDLAQAQQRLQQLERVEQRCGGRPGTTALIASIPACLPESSSGERGHSFPTLLLDPVNFLFVDPIVAVGYDYIINSGSPLIASVLLPVLAGTSSYSLVGDSSGGLCQAFQTPLGAATPGVAFSFSSPVSCFGVRGINPASALDPNDPLAFVTGLLGSSAGSISLNQIPLSFDTDNKGGPGNTSATPVPLPVLAPPLAWGFSRRLRRHGRLAHRPRANPQAPRP
jgi:hypothetical protein